MLEIPGKYRYEGNLVNQKKQGIGIEEDHLRATKYVGSFQNNKRNGYGELTYLNRDSARLKGFWTDGIMKAGDGVYLSSEGKFL